jgi:hypothetical protein
LEAIVIPKKIVIKFARTFYPVLSAVANSVEKIENSLFGVATSVTEYRYGSDAMIAAITLTI